MSIHLTAEGKEKRNLSQLENTLFSELKIENPKEETKYPLPIVADRQIFEYCNLIDSWKSGWLWLGASYPVPIGTGGVREKEYVELLKFRKDMGLYLELRKKYPQQTALPEGIVIYAQSVLKRIDESLSNLDD